VGFHKENTKLSKKLLRYTIILLIVAGLALVVALPPAVEAISISSTRSVTKK
jgi:hypothetical protein